MNLNEKSKNALIIINPVSGLGNPKERRKLIEESAKKLGWEGEIAETTLKKTAKHITEKAINKGTKHIVVCGGDGTIMEVLKAAFKKPVKIGVVPLGTGNLFARNLKIPNDTKDAIEVALFGQVQKIDVGDANGNFFSITTSMGVDVGMIKDANRELKNKFGFLAYVFAAIKNVNKKPDLYSIIIDGNKTKPMKAKSIMISNMGKLPGNIKFVPTANPVSGRLSIGIILANDTKSWASIFFNALRGNVNKSFHYKLYKGKNIEVIPLKGPRPYQCDGDLFPPASKLKVKIFPSSVNVCVGKNTS
jgi:diacylglycerol kinase (ATP)